MTRPLVILDPAQPRVVGSFGSHESIVHAHPIALEGCCDAAEIRLDLLAAEGITSGERPWAHLNVPLLFTARRGDEGGAGDLPAAARSALLEPVLEEASLVDIELVSADEMPEIFARMKVIGVPWIASWHDFEGRDESFARIPAMAEQAARAGAACFKAAVRLHHMDDLSKLAGLLEGKHPLPLSLMGMGPLAPVSRLLCAQYGSVLNYGYLGNVPTAPGQWSAVQLKAAISAAVTGLT